MIKDKLKTDMTAALKSHEKIKLDVLRFILSEINYEEIEKKGPLIDQEIQSLIAKEVKRRLEAIEMFKKGGRTEGIPLEEQQIEVLRTYLPAQLDNKEIEQAVLEEINKAGPNPQMGPIIGMVMGKLKGKADGSVVATIVKEKLLPR